MRELLQALWPRLPACEAFVTFWFKPSKRSLHLPASALADLDSSDEDEFRVLARDSDVYFGLGLRSSDLGESRQGGKKDIVALPGIALDVDFLDDRAHASKKLPSSFEEAKIILEDLPKPSALVNTGNGVHAYWFFLDLLVLDCSSRRTQVQKIYRLFQKPIITRASQAGWHLDNTASIQRVWRVPGFVNQKTNKDVYLDYCYADQRYGFAELGLKIPARRSSEQRAGALSSNLRTRVRDALGRVSSSNKYFEAVRSALAGESMAAPGRRDEVLQGVCSTIAWLPESRDEDPEELAEILRPSLFVWAEEEDATKTIEDELSKASDKIRRSQKDYVEKQETQRARLEGIARALVGGNFFTRHALIQYRSTFYIFDFRRGEYSKPRTKDELIPLMRDYWDQSPLSIYYVNNKGETKTKSIARLCEEYCTVVDEVVGDMTIDNSRFVVSENIFYEALARKRIKEGRFNEKIDEWLRLLAGDKYEKVCDWIAAVPQLEQQCCALYLDGKTGAGKGALAFGLARLWRKGGPTPFLHAISDYNNEIVQCPMIWIDEGVPGRRGNITAELRAIVGRSGFSCTEKYVSNRPVIGSIRLLICANNSNVLMFGNSEISTSDLEAVVGRILHVRARTEAAEWLEENNVEGKLTRSWVEGDLLARHCLYLAENRKLTPGRRFLVEGDETHMHRKLAMQGETNGLVYEWLVRFATDPGVLLRAYKAKNQPSLALLDSEGLLVNTQGVIDSWRLYMPDDSRRPTSTRIGKVLSKLSSKTVRRGPRGDRNRYYVIKSDMVIEWCREQQIGNEDRIEENLNGLE